jgi:pimeloyl-ACP methyl ester carboxylesterase
MNVSNGENIFFFLKVRIIAMEYPGYGVYKHSSPNAFRLLEDAEAVLEYLIKKVGYDSKNIILFGRSIGSGAATHLASKTKCGALVLMSAFTSLRSVVRDLAGNWASMLLKVMQLFIYIFIYLNMLFSYIHICVFI